MKIRTRIIWSFLLFLIPIIAMGLISSWSLDRIQQNISQETAQNIKILENASKLNSLTQFIRYYDEVLTQSARNYAFTGDKKWNVRYEQNAVLLDNNIKEAIRLGDAEDKQLFNSVNDSNIALVKMEENSMSLTAKGQQQEAIKILNGEEYSRQKKIYQDALIKYFEKQGKKYNDALTSSTSQTTQMIEYSRELIKQRTLWVTIALILTGLFAIILGLLTASRISKPITILVKTAREITRGNLSTRANIKGKDEIAELAASFNEMTDKLQKVQMSIEVKVKEKTVALEETNKFMTGRELKMIELKKKIAELEAKK